MVTNLLRAQDAARMLGISKCLVYQLVRSGKLQAVRINSAIRFREEDINGFIDSNLSWGEGPVLISSNNNRSIDRCKNDRY